MSGLYVKLDVNYFDDPKLVEVSTEAELLFVRSLCFAKRMLSDGLVTRAQARRFAADIAYEEDGGVDGLVKELVSVGLWDECDDGYVISAWAFHNDLAEEVEAKRQAKREGGSWGNHRRWHVGPKGRPSEGCPHCESQQQPPPESEGRSDHRSDGVGGSDRMRSPETETETETETEVNPSSPPGGGDADASPDHGFEQFWGAYPKRHGKKPGKQNALLEWRKLTLDQRRRAYIGACHLAASDQLPKDPERFLRRSKGGKGSFPFDDWQEPAAPTSNGRAPKGQTGHDAWTAKAAQLRQQEATR